MNSFYPNSYYKNPTIYKCCKIKDWKSRGVIYHDFDELFEVYINTNKCSHCLKEFINSRDRCLDHCHKTGSFRKIVCNSCNSMDSYLKYPPHFTSKDKKQQMDKEYREANRDKMIEYQKEWQKANREQLNEKAKKYYEKNRDKINIKVNCFFCNKHMMIKSLRKHYLNGCCVIKPIT